MSVTKREIELPGVSRVAVAQVIVRAIAAHGGVSPDRAYLAKQDYDVVEAEMAPEIRRIINVPVLLGLVAPKHLRLEWDRHG